MLHFLNLAYDKIRPHLLSKTPIIFSIKGTIPAMLLVFVFSKYVQLFLSFLLLGKYDNVNASHRYGGSKEKNWRVNAVQRAYNAHMNHFEAFVQFSIAVICYLLWGSSSSNGKIFISSFFFLLILISIYYFLAEALILTNAFIFVRVAYNAAYVLAGVPALATIRSLVYFTGFIIIMRIFSLALPEGMFY